MADRPLQHLLGHLRRVALPSGVTDADLLGRFAEARDEAAFEALVWRHGSLVYGVCRRVLGHTQDAEDAFQAAFMILARKAGTVRRRGAIGPWLYQVARRAAMRARGRPILTGPLPADLAVRSLRDSVEDRDLRRLIDEEIDRLPARYRAAVILHYLEGRTTTEAAAALGCPPGTIMSRLAWARRRLRSRLTARGAALPAAFAGVGLEGAAGAVPAQWVMAAVGAAGAFAAGGRAGRPALLAAGVLRTMFIARLRVGAVVMLGALAAGAGLIAPGISPARPKQADQAIPPAVVVTVERPTRSTGEFEEFNGLTAASAIVDVRSRITSQIEKVGFQAGAKVKRGDLLFELDNRAYRVEYGRAQAEQQRALSHLKRVTVDLDRLRKIVATGAADASEVSRANGAVDEAQAGVLAATAGLDRAKLDLDATRIASPIDGQTGGAVLGVGNLAAPTTTLVTVVSADPVYVDFQLDDRSLLRLRKRLERGDVIAQVNLGDDKDFSRHAKIVFVDNQADPRTRTVRIRAVLQNSRNDILPGMFARIRLPIGEQREGLLVPSRAVRKTDNGQHFVVVVGTGDVLEWRPVKLGPSSIGGTISVSAGIGSDDRIVIGDLAALAPGAPIRVHEADPPK